MTAAPATEEPTAPVLWNGERIKARWLQTRAWAAVIGLLGVGLVAGLYFGIGQVDWYVHSALCTVQLAGMRAVE